MVLWGFEEPQLNFGCFSVPPKISVLRRERRRRNLILRLGAPHSDKKHQKLRPQKSAARKNFGPPKKFLPTLPVFTLPPKTATHSKKSVVAIKFGGANRCSRYPTLGFVKARLGGARPTKALEWLSLSLL